MTKPHRILVVDDSEIVRETLTAGLGAAGYAVTTVATFDEMIAAHPAGFSLILMDLNMPELYGDEVASVLRHDRGVCAAIYMLSNAPVAELAKRAKEAGLDGYISKADGFEAILARIKQLLPPTAS